MATPHFSREGGRSAGSSRRTERRLERRVLHAEHAHLSRTLRASEIMADLYSADVISSSDMERVDGATTTRDKNEIILRELKLCRYPITTLCEALDKCASLRYVADDLRTALEKKRREYDQRSNARLNVSPQQLQVCRKKLTDAGEQLVLVTTDLTAILDLYPKALQLMKTALTTIYVVAEDEQVEAVIKSREFIVARNATELFRAFAVAKSVLDDQILKILVRASQVDEAIKRFEAYQRARDPTVPLVVFESNTPRNLLPPPASSEAAAVGARELVVRINRESLTVGDVGEIREGVSGALNVPPLAVSPRGVILSSISVVFWVSEAIVAYIQSQVISVATLHFLHDEGIVDIRIESDYLLTTPSALCLEFWEACEDGDVEAVLSCLFAGVSVDVATPPQSESNTGLMYATLYGSDEVVHLLLSSGADHNIQNTLGSTALMFAAQNGRTETAEVLLREGADANVQNKEGFTALMVAAEYGHTETAEVLLREGADANVQNKLGNTALMAAAEHGHTEIAEVLLREGADANVQSKNGDTALMMAAEHGRTETAEVLLREEADANVQNKEGFTALMFAAQDGHTETAEVLLREGADVNVQEEAGYSALHFAAQYGYTAVVSSLLRASADPNSVASWQGGSTPLMVASWMGHVETVDVLLSSGVDVNQTNEEGMTALMHAAAGGYVNVLKSLIENKADVNMLTKDGVSALDMAREENVPLVCDLLTQHGAKPGPGSQEKAKTGLARLWARFKKAMKGPLQTSGLGDVGGVKGRRKKKLEATSTSPPTQTSH